MLYGRLLDNNSHRCESLTDLSYPVVLLQGRKSGSDRFIESLRGNLYGVLNVSKILYRNRASSEDHKQSVAYSSFVRQCERDRIASTNISIMAVVELVTIQQGSGLMQASASLYSDSYCDSNEAP